VADGWWWYTEQTDQVEFEFAAGARNKVGIPVQDACPTRTLFGVFPATSHELQTAS
jgi:hypothetical protein